MKNVSDITRQKYLEFYWIRKDGYVENVIHQDRIRFFHYKKRAFEDEGTFECMNGISYHKFQPYNFL